MAKRLSFQTVLFASLFFFLSIAAAHAGGTAEEAEAIVNKALAYVKANGVDKAVETFNQKESEYVSGDLYVFMFRVSETPGARVVTLAHPVNPGLIGKDLYDLKDPNGYQFMAAMAKKAMEDKGGWVHYKWSNPLTRKIGEKSSFVMPAGPDVFVGCGIYK
ncbi:cache domain-containing protein [Desulfatiferula olefinivorans]